MTFVILSYFLVDSDENAVSHSEDFGKSEVSDKFYNKKFAKASSFSQEYEQTFWWIAKGFKRTELVSVNKLKWTAILRKQNAVNKNLWTANNPINRIQGKLEGIGLTYSL